MNDISREYCTKVIKAAPFADNIAGIPQMVELITALRDALDAKEATAPAPVVTVEILERWERQADIYCNQTMVAEIRAAIEQKKDTQ